MLFLAFRIGLEGMDLGVCDRPGGGARLRKVKARNLGQVLDEISKAKVRFGVCGDYAGPRTATEAGRDGFWLHRWLEQHKIANLVVDSASGEVNPAFAAGRKTDSLDAGKLVEMLARHASGEQKVWHIVRVPGKAQMRINGNCIMATCVSCGVSKPNTAVASRDCWQ